MGQFLGRGVSMESLGEDRKSGMRKRVGSKHSAGYLQTKRMDGGDGQQQEGRINIKYPSDHRFAPTPPSLQPWITTLLSRVENQSTSGGASIRVTPSHRTDETGYLEMHLTAGWTMRRWWTKGRGGPTSSGASDSSEAWRADKDQQWSLSTNLWGSGQLLPSIITPSAAIIIPTIHSSSSSLPS